MKKIPARPSKVAGFSILLLAFFIWGNFSRGQGAVTCACKNNITTCPSWFTPWANCTCRMWTDVLSCTNLDEQETVVSCTCKKNTEWLQVSTCPSWFSPASNCNCKKWSDILSCTDLDYEAEQNLGVQSCEAYDPTRKSSASETAVCESWYIKDGFSSPAGTFRCCKPENSVPTTTTTPWLPEDSTVQWMTIGPKCLLNGQCKFNIYDALGIRTSVRNEGDPTSVGIFVQDIVLSATMFIGTVVTIAIIVSGLMWIMAGANGKDPTKAKSWLINSLIGLLIVVSSYLIIRLVQYIAKWF